PGVPVVSGARGDAADVIAARAAAVASPLSVLGRDFALTAETDATLTYRSAAGAIGSLRLALAGRHQRDNAALALRALEVAPALVVAPEAMRTGLATVRWPGRLQVVRHAPDVVLDGAHNPA